MTMPMLRGWFFRGLWALAAVAAAGAAEAPVRREWTIEGTAREGLVHVPAGAKAQPTPVVFVFHGHGGTMRHVARTFALHTHWPEAIVVYLQGLNTPGKLTDPEGKKPGWQNAPGLHGDRDLKLFDAVLAGLRAECRVDEARIYSTGHSNGGGFTYLLWAARGDVLAAVAPSAAAASAVRTQLKPKPVLHLAGRRDELVKFTWQEATMAQLRKLNDCGPGQPWAQDCTLYPSKLGAPVVTMIHDGAHNFPTAGPALIVKFFKAQRRP